MSQRYERGQTVQRPATAGNLATAAVGLAPGGSLVQMGIAALKGTPTDPYTGAKGTATTFSYDGGDRMRGRRMRAQRSGLGAAQQGGTLG